MYRKSVMLSAAAALAFVAAPALAAGDTTPRTGSGAVSQVQGEAQGQRGARMQASDLLGQSIENRQGETIGEIDSIIIGRNGEVEAVIASIGGFLGIGDREVAIEWNELQVRDGGRVIQSSMSRDQLERLPEFSYTRAERHGSASVDRGDQSPQAARQRSEDRLAAQSARQSGQGETWTGAGPIRASDLLGASVVNQNGEEIGEVEDLVIANGQSQIVLGVGEFLGMGGRSVVLKLADAKLQQQQNRPDEVRVSVGLSEQELKSLPAYDPDRWEGGQGSRN